MLYEPIQVGKLTVPNRIMRSAVWEAMADPKGNYTPELNELYMKLAHGGVGFIITSHCFVIENGRAGHGQLGLYDDELIPSFKETARQVHETESKYFVQLAHAGRFASAVYGKDSEIDNVGPSGQDIEKTKTCREMTVADIEEAVKAFAAAAVRAKEAGFDGVQIHGAHGYLISQFLSQLFNKRTDNYGGSLENRARFVREVMRAIRAATGPDFVVGIKINGEDYTEPGFLPEESVQVAQWLEEDGLDFVEISGGNTIGHYMPIRKGLKHKIYYESTGKLFKSKLNIPVAVVGGVRSRQDAERLIEENVCDVVSMGRPFIREPDLANKWKEAQPACAECISCGKCFAPIFRGGGLECEHARLKAEMPAKKAAKAEAKA